MCTCLSRTRVAASALDARGASGPREAFSGPPRPQRVCARGGFYLSRARRARRSWIPRTLSIADPWVHSPLGISFRAVRDNLNGASFASPERTISRPFRAAQADPQLRCRHAVCRNVITYADVHETNYSVAIEDNISLPFSALFHIYLTSRHRRLLITIHFSFLFLYTH